MHFYVTDHCTFEPGEDGITVITCRVPSSALPQLLRLIDDMQHICRVFYTKTRASEAISAARHLGVIR